MTTQRTIIMTENGRKIFRYDVNSARNTPEEDVFRALVDMNKAGIINIEKLTSVMNEKYGVVISENIDKFVMNHVFRGAIDRFDNKEV